MAATPKHKHRSLLVLRSYDCEHERALCLECGADVPEWKLVPYMSTAFYYRYISTEDFLNGVVPELHIGA